MTASGSASGAWSVANYATGSQSGAWSVFNAVQASQSGAWTVYGAVAASVSGAWSVSNFAEGSQAGAWSVVSFVEATQDGSWSVVNFAQATQFGAWSVSNFADGSVSGAWSVQQGDYSISPARAALIYQIALLHGLDPANPLTIPKGDGVRQAGGVMQTISGAGPTTVTTTATTPFTGDLDAWIDALAAEIGLTAPLQVTPTGLTAGSLSQVFAETSTAITVTRAS